MCHTVTTAKTPCLPFYSTNLPYHHHGLREDVCIDLLSNPLGTPSLRGECILAHLGKLCRKPHASLPTLPCHAVFYPPKLVTRRCFRKELQGILQRSKQSVQTPLTAADLAELVQQANYMLQSAPHPTLRYPWCLSRTDHTND